MEEMKNEQANIATVETKNENNVLTEEEARAQLSDAITSAMEELKNDKEMYERWYRSERGDNSDLRAKMKAIKDVYHAMFDKAKTNELRDLVNVFGSLLDVTFNEEK